MYRDEESVAAEHAADVERELEIRLAPRLAVARRWRPRFWHWVAALAVWVPVVRLGPTESSLTTSHSSWLGSWLDHPDLFFAAFFLTGLATALLLMVFFAAMHVAAWFRATEILARFGPPPDTMRATERLPLLKRRLADLRGSTEGGGPRDPVDPPAETP